jgi:hypothetical protein
MKRFIFATILIASTFALSVTPTQAATYPIISGQVVDVNGDPVSNVQITVMSGTLKTFTCTDKYGKYSVRTRANRQATLTMERCMGLDGAARYANFEAMPSLGPERTFGANETIDVGTTDIIRNFSLPATALDIDIRAVDIDGNAITGKASAEFIGNFVFDGIGRALNYYIGSSAIDDNGHIYLHTFQPSNNTDVWTFGCDGWLGCDYHIFTSADHVGIADQDGDGHSDGIRVTYLSAPGVEQSIWVPAFEWTTGRAEVVFDAVPEISVSTPASVSANKTSYATASISPSLLTGLRSVATASNQPTAAAFKGKTVKLYSRTVLGTNKFGKWTFEGSCKLSASGKCKAKFKISKKSQLVFRATDFALPIKTKTVKVKK